MQFGGFMRELGIDAELRRSFDHLKSGRMVVYPMGAQLRLLMDVFAAGEHRPFAVESLSADALFTYLAGGICPSLDTIYRDLARFDDAEIARLDALVAEQGLAVVRAQPRTIVHLDIDTTVTPLFGEHEGAMLGHNPRYHGRPSYHPILCRVAETDTIIGAQLRPGDRGFGDEDAPWVGKVIDRLRSAVGPKALIYTRIDAAGDCTSVLRTIDARGAFFLAKAKLTPDLAAAIWMTTRWTTVDWDADGKPTRQVAQIDFSRGEWTASKLKVRVIALRSKERDIGKQVRLWNLDDYDVQAFVTNDFTSDIDDLARRYNGRAGIEPLIAELKGSYGIGKVPSQSFAANHAALLLKMLVHNLLRRYVTTRFPLLHKWRAPWLRRALLLVPGRLVRSGRGHRLRMAPRPLFAQLE